MATPQKGEPSKVIGSVSKFAGTLVGTAVITGKRIIGSATLSSKGPPDKSGGKTVRAPARKKRKAVRKTETKAPKTKKKKAVKRKGTGPSGKSVVSKKKRAHSPAKKKKGVTPKKATTRQNKAAKTSAADDRV
jgi:hypothetical protein